MEKGGTRMAGKERMLITGGNPLEGEVQVSGGKNTAVAVIPASLLCDEPCTIENLPDIEDVHALVDILKELGAKVVVSYADSEVQKKFLLRNGADEVINPAVHIARWASVRFASDHVLDFITIDKNHAILEVTVPQAWKGKTVGQLDVRRKHGITLIAVKEGDQTNLAVTPDTLIKGDETLLVLGDQKSVRKCFGV